MTDAVSEFAQRRKPVPALDEIEAEIAQHRRATEESTYRHPGGTWEPRRKPLELDEIAMMVASLPLRAAMEMAEAIVKLPEFKPPQTKIELAMLLNEWAEKRLEPPLK